jgi:branched-chain amino acid transport system permease protein
LFGQYLIDGLALGSVYAVLALSYTLIFGVIRVVNFAQGEMITLGAFGALGAWVLCAPLPPPLRVAAMLLGSVAGSAFLALIMERFLFRPLLKRSSPSLIGLICSLGVSLFMQNVMRMAISSSDVLFPALLPSEPYTVHGYQVAPVQIVLLAAVAFFGTATYWFVEKTRFGVSIMAVRDNPELATTGGISVPRVLKGVFLAASVLAAGGGVMMGSYYGVARYDMGFFPGIKAFTASIMGGIGNVRGAVLSGLLLGVVESLGSAYISSAYKDGFAFALLVIILLFRPQGLLGGVKE